MTETSIWLQWALEVHYLVLGAKLESYANTRGHLLSFRFCWQKSPRLSGLPYQVMATIESYIEESFFEEQLYEWQKRERCINGMYTFYDHYNEDDLKYRKQMYFSDQKPRIKKCDHDLEVGAEVKPSAMSYSEKELDSTTEAKFRAWAENHADDHLDDKVTSHKEMTTELYDYLDGNTRFFGNCQRLFKRDFGVEPIFNVLETYNNIKGKLGSLNKPNIKAYITYPIRPITFHSVRQEKMISWVIRQAFTDEDVRSLTKERQEEFEKARYYLQSSWYDVWVEEDENKKSNES